MTWLRVVASRLSGWLRRYRHDEEFADELRFHLEMERRRWVDAGMSEAEARRRARLRFGGVERVREEVRDARGISALDTLKTDFRHAVRYLARRPRLTAVAIATLSLGIGATTAISSVAEALLLRPLPYPESDRLVALRSTYRQGVGIDGRTARATVIDWERAQSFDAVVAYAWVSVALPGAGLSEQLSGLWVTPGFEDLFAPRLLGRSLTNDDRLSLVMVLGRGVRLRIFESDPTLVGKLVDLYMRNLEGVTTPPPVRALKSLGIGDYARHCETDVGQVGSATAAPADVRGPAKARTIGAREDVPPGFSRRQGAESPRRRRFHELLVAEG